MIEEWKLAKEEKKVRGCFTCKKEDYTLTFRQENENNNLFNEDTEETKTHCGCKNYSRKKAFKEIEKMNKELRKKEMDDDDDDNGDDNDNDDGIKRKSIAELNAKFNKDLKDIEDRDPKVLTDQQMRNKALIYQRGNCD